MIISDLVARLSKVEAIHLTAAEVKTLWGERFLLNMTDPDREYGVPTGYFVIRKVKYSEDGMEWYVVYFPDGMTNHHAAKLVGMLAPLIPISCRTR